MRSTVSQYNLNKADFESIGLSNVCERCRGIEHIAAPKHDLEAVFWGDPSFEPIDQYLMPSSRIRNPAER